jgi:hypothetical protein
MRTGMLTTDHPIRVLLFLVWLVASCVYSQPALTAPLPEYQVKAVLIYKITKFIEWPGHTSTHADSALNVCVLGDDPFEENLDLIQGKSVRGRVLVIHKFDHLQSLPSDCHALFISPSEKSRLRPILETLGSLPILTIGDTEGFAKAGSMVNFINKNNTIRFEINLDASRKAGLKISSQLLELAIIVGN